VKAAELPSNTSFSARSQSHVANFSARSGHFESGHEGKVILPPSKAVSGISSEMIGNALDGAGFRCASAIPQKASVNAITDRTRNFMAPSPVMRYWVKIG